jgi:hypothetical protein
LEVCGRDAATKQVGCSFEKFGVFYTYPAIVPPSLGVGSKAFNGQIGDDFQGPEAWKRYTGRDNGGDLLNLV